MKKIILVFSLTTLVASCGNNTSNKTSETNKDTMATTPAQEENPEIDKGLNLVAKSDCLTCHKIDEKFTGPAYTAVAAKYPDNEQVIDSLSDKIIKGGTGNWGAIPMTPHPTISKEDAKSMVKYVLSLKK